MSGMIEVLAPLVAGALAWYMARRRERGLGAWAAGAGVASLVFLIVRVVVSAETDRPLFGSGGPEAAGHIYVANADGSGKQRLTQRLGGYGDLDWSPDGSRIVVSVYAPFGSSGIYTVNADGTNARNLTTGDGGIGAHSPMWSPDGSTIAFLTLHADEPSTIWVMDGHGNDQRRLREDRGWCDGLVWSPDGARLACRVFGDDESHIRVLDAHNGAPVDIAPPEGDAYGFTWSPDSKRIAFHAFGGQTSLYLIRADSTDLVPLRTTVTADALAWSPDGKRIAFTGGDQVYMIGADGTGETALTPPGRYDFAGGLTWSPDGQRLAFWAYPKEAPYPDLYVMDADGAGLHSVATIVTAEPKRKRLDLSSPFMGQAWRMLADPRNWPGAYSSGLLTTQSFSPPSGFCWSPDGKKLAFISAANAEGGAGILVSAVRCLTVPLFIVCAPAAVFFALRTWRRQGRTPGTMTGLLAGGLVTVLYGLLLVVIVSAVLGG